MSVSELLHSQPFPDGSLRVLQRKFILSYSLCRKHILVLESAGNDSLLYFNLSHSLLPTMLHKPLQQTPTNMYFF